MASINLTAANGVNNILMFSKYYQTIVAIEPDVINSGTLLHPEEASFIRGTVAYDDSTAIVACQERLDLGLDYYYDVKHQITSFLKVWDAILDEKRRYDAVGWPRRSHSFMDSFQICSYLIPQRVGIGFVGPYVDSLQLDTGFNNIPVLGRPASYHSETSTAVNSPLHWAEHERSIEDGDHGDQLLSDEEEYLEVLALSPTVSNNSFEDINVQDGGAEIISLSSDDGGADSEYSDESDELQFCLEPDGENVPNSGLEEPNPYRPKDFDDALWEKWLSGLPEAQRPRREEAQRDQNIGKRLPVSNELKPRGLALKDVTLKKRKFMAAHGSNDDEYEEGTRHGGKRPRTL